MDGETVEDRWMEGWLGGETVDDGWTGAETTAGGVLTPCPPPPGALLGALPLRGLGLTPLLPGVLPPNLPLGLQPPPLGPLVP